jgi:hypothetical protein
MRTGWVAVWRSRSWWLFVGLLTAALVTVVIIAFVTSSPSMSAGGAAPLPPGVSQPAAPYPTPYTGPGSSGGSTVPLAPS